MAEDEAFHHDPAFFANSAQQYEALTPEILTRVAAKYLRRGRLVMSLIPAGRSELVSRPELPYTNISERNTKGSD
jgi:hypothetical protein